MMTSRELCVGCDRETDRAGGADDSLFLDNGTGPYCLECWQPLRIEELETERDTALETIERVLIDERDALKAENERLRKEIAQGSADRSWMAEKNRRLMLLTISEGSDPYVYVQYAINARKEAKMMSDGCRVCKKSVTGYRYYENNNEIYTCSDCVIDERDALKARVSDLWATIERVRGLKWVLRDNIRGGTIRYYVADDVDAAISPNAGEGE